MQRENVDNSTNVYTVNWFPRDLCLPSYSGFADKQQQVASCVIFKFYLSQFLSTCVQTCVTINDLIQQRLCLTYRCWHTKAHLMFFYETNVLVRYSAMMANSPTNAPGELRPCGAPSAHVSTTQSWLRVQGSKLREGFKPKHMPRDMPSCTRGLVS